LAVSDLATFTADFPIVFATGLRKETTVRNNPPIPVSKDVMSPSLH